nr:MAG TPA: hypothetical protein [Caudoviricetes sp.]
MNKFGKIGKNLRYVLKFEIKYGIICIRDR